MPPGGPDSVLLQLGVLDDSVPVLGADQGDRLRSADAPANELITKFASRAAGEPHTDRHPRPTQTQRPDRAVDLDRRLLVEQDPTYLTNFWTYGGRVILEGARPTRRGQVMPRACYRR